MRLLLIDDLEYKIFWIKKFLKRHNIKFDEISYLNGAKVKLEEQNLYQGIILDMQFPIFENSLPENKSGESFLNWMKHHDFKIPILGNSSIDFQNVCNYPYFCGQLKAEGKEEKKLIEFLKIIEEKS